MPLSAEAIWTLRTYLRKRTEPSLPYFLELTKDGIILRELPLKFRSPRWAGMVRTKRYRIYDPITGDYLGRFRLWLYEADLAKGDDWSVDYHRPLLDFDRWVEENEADLLYTESIPIKIKEPIRAVEALRMLYEKPKEKVRVWSKENMVYLTYSDRYGWLVNLDKQILEHWIKMPETITPLLIPLEKHVAFSALYYSGVADTLVLKRAAKNEYRRLGGRH